MEKNSKISFQFDAKEDIPTLLLIIVLAFLQAFAINAFYVTQGFLSGGVTGISLLFSYAIEGLPSWPIILLLNVPITILGIIYLDLKFALFSVLGTAVFSLAIALTDFISIPAIDPILSALVGGAIVGISGAPVVKRNATLGGMDVIAMILTKKYSIPMGTFNIIFNLIIMTTLGFVSGMELAILSMLAMFVCNTAFNFALVGLNRTHTVFIISDEWDDIAPEIMRNVKRGVTYIPAEGAYTGTPKKLVYCIVKTVELSKIKSIVMAHDKHAMFSVIDTKQVIGRGFGAIN